MEKQLVTCPVCKTDQHVYGKRICNHVGDGGIRCLGSREPIQNRSSRPIELKTNLIYTSANGTLHYARSEQSFVFCRQLTETGLTEWVIQKSPPPDDLVCTEIACQLPRF